MTVYRHLVRHTRGVTLVEVIIALIMIALVVGALLKTQAQTVRAVGASEHEVMVMMAMKKRLAEVDLYGSTPSELPAEMPLPEYCPSGTLFYTSKRFSDKSSAMLRGLSQIKIDTVRATWQDGARTITQEMVRYRYEPQESSK